MSSTPGTLKTLYKQMADLTYSECKKKCNFDAVCCSRFYCDLVIREARKKYGIELREENKPVPLLDDNNQCIVEPYMRPLCTLHICEKLLWNGEFSDKYFELRTRIEELEGDIYEFI